MKNLKAIDLMTRPVVSARKNASARDIAMQLLSGLYSGLPVTDDEGRVIGIVTEFDLLKQILAGRDLVTLRAEEVMTRESVTVDVNAPLQEVLNLMMEKNIIRIPVTENGSLTGVIARCDILKTHIEPEFVMYI
jgi:CBS domain-containing protein